jgi:hypothetical protein
MVTKQHPGSARSNSLTSRRVSKANSLRVATLAISTISSEDKTKVKPYGKRNPRDHSKSRIPVGTRESSDSINAVFGKILIRFTS